MPSPVLERRTAGALAWHTDLELLERHGILVAFSERTGGTSVGPWSSLNLAAHVGDDPTSVDANRLRLLSALGLEETAERLTCAEQVHGARVTRVTPERAGAGASARGRWPIPGTDAMITALPDTPLMMCFADCVPVVLVAVRPGRTVAVAHAGWRGALAGLPGIAARALASAAGCPTSSLLAYVGPHICRECYEVGDELASQFAAAFGNIVAAQGRVDLGAVVSEGLRAAGVPTERQAGGGTCTTHPAGRFFSYRAEGVTGRHGALVVVL